MEDEHNIKKTPKAEIEGLTDKDLHCCARILQSIMFAPREYDENGVSHDYNPFYACKYCKYRYDCMRNKYFFEGTRERLQALTGVNLEAFYDMDDREKKFIYYV